MTVRVHRDNGKSNGETEVHIFTLSNGYSQSDLLKKLEYAFNLAQSRGTTFLGVLNTGYRMITMNQIGGFFDEFNFINTLPKEDPEYRICLAIDATGNIEESLMDSLQETPDSLAGWLWYLAKGAYEVITVVDVLQIMQEHPLGRNPWVSIENNIEDAIFWCRQNASWV